MKKWPKEIYSKWVSALQTRSNSTFNPSARYLAFQRLALSVIHWAVWSFEPLCRILKVNSRINSLPTCLCPHHIWVTCTIRASFSMQACGSWRSGANQSALCSFPWAMLRTLSRPHFSNFLKLQACSTSKMWYSSLQRRINTRLLIQPESKCAKKPQVIQQRRAATIRQWCRILWETSIK